MFVMLSKATRYNNASLGVSARLVAGTGGFCLRKRGQFTRWHGRNCFARSQKSVTAHKKSLRDQQQRSLPIPA